MRKVLSTTMCALLALSGLGLAEAASKAPIRTINLATALKQGFVYIWAPAKGINIRAPMGTKLSWRPSAPPGPASHFVGVAPRPGKAGLLFRLPAGDNDVRVVPNHTAFKTWIPKVLPRVP